MKTQLIKTIALTLLTATGCTAVRPVTAPAPFISVKHPSMVYVVDKQGRIYSIARPVVQGDSVVGVSPRLDREVGIPMSSISQMEASQVSKGRTVAFIALMGAAAGGFVYLAAHAGGDTSCVTYPPGDIKVGSVSC